MSIFLFVARVIARPGNFAKAIITLLIEKMSLKKTNVPLNLITSIVKHLCD